jgi:Leucine-rich repeat (LRR) protein
MSTSLKLFPHFSNFEEDISSTFERKPKNIIMAKIELRDTKMHFKDVARLVNGTDDLQGVSFTNFEFEGDEDDAFFFSKSIRAHPHLKYFSMSNVTITDESVSLDPVVSMLLITSTKLESLKLEKSSITVAAVATLGYCNTIKTVELPGMNLDDDSAATIAMAIASSKSVEKLDLSNNMLSDTGCEIIMKALDKNTTIKEINVEGNNVSQAEQIKLGERMGGFGMAA